VSCWLRTARRDLSCRLARKGFRQNVASAIRSAMLQPVLGGAVGFPPSDSPVGDCRRCGDEPFGLRAERRPGTAAWAGRYSTSTRGLELAAAWTGGRGHIRCWAGRCSTGARRLERAVSWTGGRGHIRCAADAAGHHCEDRFRRARQSRGNAGSEKAVFPRPAAAVAVPAPRRSGSASRRRWLISTPAWTAAPNRGPRRQPYSAARNGMGEGCTAADNCLA
jgi:hypothetical protein